MHDVKPNPSPVLLTIPADPSFVRIARLVASGVGANADLSVDDIEDLRIAIDEVCIAALECSDGGDIHLRFTVDPDAVRFEGESTYRVEDAPNDGQREELSHQILRVVLDECSLVRRDGTLQFTAAKRRT